MVDSVLLPNGEQQFFDLNGDPLAGGLVYMYVPGTTTPKTTWVDQGETTPNANPIILDPLGRAIIWGNGIYRQLVTDAAGNLIFDQLTSDGGIADLQNQINTINGEIATINSEIAAIQAQLAQRLWLAFTKSPSSTSYQAAPADSGTLFISNAAGGALTITLPDTTTIKTGWYIGLLHQTNAIAAQVFGSSSEHVLLPSGQALLTVSTAAFDYENLILSFDGTNYEVIEATPQTWLALGSVGFQHAINASYTALASDNGGTLLLNGNAFYQVTFNLPTSYPHGYTVHVTNADDSNGKLLSLSGQTMMLWPRQGIEVQAGSDGKWHLYGGPQRWQLDTDTAIYVSPGGSDLNDGLTPGTPLALIQTAINLARGGSNTDIGAGIDQNNRSVTILPAPGTYSEQLGIFGGIVGANVITIQGVVGGADQVKLIVGATGQMGVHARDLGEVQIKWIELACGAGSSCVQAEQGGVVDIENCIFGSAVGGNMVVSQDGGNINFNGPCTLAGNASNWIFCQTGGRVTLGGETFTISGSINFTGDIIGVTANGLVASNGTPCIFVNSGSASGVSYNVSLGGGLKLDGTVLPGSPGSVTSPGWVSP